MVFKDGVSFVLSQPVSVGKGWKIRRLCEKKEGGGSYLPMPGAALTAGEALISKNQAS